VPTDTRPLRADAERNRRRLIDAAVEVFAERGLEASTAEIARRAGVGQGTVFRRFPTKDDLVAAIVVDRLTDIDAKVVALAANPP
jgi:AcrR family transcriptional regulator